MRLKYYFTLFIYLNVSIVIAQDRLQGGKPYTAGESFLAPMVGMKVTLPENWKGYYPHNSEIFAMANDTSVDVRCMYFANQTNLKKLASNWKKGFPLAEGLSIKLGSRINNDGDIMSAKVLIESNTNIEGQLLARCGAFGYCITAMVYGQVSEMKNYQDKLNPIVSQIEFVKPIPRSELEVFDWQKELTGKYLFAYDRAQSSKKESQVWLNLDGTFKSKMKGTGIFKNEAGKYKGTKKGSYLIYNEKNGEPAKLVLLFTKLPEVTLQLEKKEDQFYINNQVFYFSNH
ncbi:MAG: hypothetical protein ABJH98_15715 [Reichenbachiella sp.]|uniref:hypothetical protein n=1 Tax=Reichenbachiella sp. TaxID=2184521 RepID=UPI003296B850